MSRWTHGISRGRHMILVEKDPLTVGAQDMINSKLLLFIVNKYRIVHP